MSKISAPSRICIYSDEDRPKTLSFFADIKNQALFFARNLVVDLTQVEFASAAASTLMFAVVNHAQLTRGDANSIKFIFPDKTQNPQGNKWIVGTGLSKALLAGNLSRLDALTSNEQYFQSAVKPYEHYPKTVLMLDKQAKLSVGQFDALTAAISEAMINVSHHAYKFLRFEGFVSAVGGERWWQCAWYDPVGDEVVFIICDLGIGVGESYKSGNHVIAFSGEPDWVLHALSFGGTRFSDLTERGNGSEDMKRPITLGESDNESLLVYTGQTKYIYTSSQQIPECTYMPERIPGTIVQWSLKRTRS
ncbi:hypothetical protein BS639_11000 [Rouxiella silvae]|uniref:Uncharacterized protein n=1 Tax=Rouxiella silvae TaxID=1646373 RepID=A0ABX3U0Z1_9GAMM|nr:hypothetical protein [Rouxiella silvae]ORJ21149.1 hypothetical protein BS639_11000 [Rouxiella silvae]